MDNNTSAPLGCTTVQPKNEKMEYTRNVEIDISMQDCHEAYIQPVNGVTNEGPYEFQMDSVRDSALDMNNMYMFMRAEVRDENHDTRKYNSNTDLTCTNFLLSTMWKSIECRVNGHPINLSASQHTGYKSLMQAMLAVDSAGAESLLPSMYTIESSSGAVYQSGASGTSSQKRRKLLNLGKTFTMCGPIVGVDFLQSDALLAPFNSLSLTFTRHDDQFIFSTPKVVASGNSLGAASIENKPKLIVHEFGIFCKRIQLTHSALKSYFQPRAMQRYLSPLSEVHTYALTTGITRKNIIVHTANVLPKQVVIGMVKTSALVGNYNENPFNFQPFNLSKLALKVNAIRVPQEPLEPDWDNKLFAREYIHLLNNTGRFKTPYGNGITMDTFELGCTLFPFDLTADACSSYHLHGGKEGILEIELEWKTALVDQITVVVMTSKDQIVTIDPNSMGTPAFNAF